MAEGRLARGRRRHRATILDENGVEVDLGVNTRKANDDRAVRPARAVHADGSDDPRGCPDRAASRSMPVPAARAGHRSTCRSRSTGHTPSDRAGAWARPRSRPSDGTGGRRLAAGPTALGAPWRCGDRPGPLPVTIAAAGGRRLRHQRRPQRSGDRRPVRRDAGRRSRDRTVRPADAEEPDAGPGVRRSPTGRSRSCRWAGSSGRSSATPAGTGASWGGGRWGKRRTTSRHGSRSPATSTR